MKFVLFYHSFTSCWNHGNAHFLRGVLSEFWHRGFDTIFLIVSTPTSRHA